MDKASPLRIKIILGQTFAVWKTNWLKLTGMTAVFLVIPVFGILLTSILLLFSGQLTSMQNVNPTQGLWGPSDIWQLVFLALATIAVGYAQAANNRFLYRKLNSEDDGGIPLPKEDGLRLKYPGASILFIFIIALVTSVGILLIGSFIKLINLLDNVWVLEIGTWLVIMGLLWTLIFINMRWLFVIPAIAIEGKGILDAFRFSWRITRGHALKITEWWGSINTIFSLVTYAFAILVYFSLLKTQPIEPTYTRLIAFFLASSLLTIIILILDTFRFTFASVLYFAFRNRANEERNPPDSV